jgi:hypothetical protein
LSNLTDFNLFRPQNKEELFNLRHSSLRTTIERAFGVLKRRFMCLGKRAPVEYDFEFQRDLVIGCCVLHNFILLNDGEDALYEQWDRENAAVEPEQPERPAMGSGGSTADVRHANELREGIATAMWNNYQDYLRSGGRARALERV